jgi:hypothetical protein
MPVATTSQVYESTLMEFLEGLQEDSDMENTWYLLGGLQCDVIYFIKFILHGTIMY